MCSPSAGIYLFIIFGFWEAKLKKYYFHVCDYLYFVFILGAISACTTGLKVLYDPFVQSNYHITDIPLTERQRLKDNHFSVSLRFFNLPLGIGPNDRGPLF